MIKKIFLLGIFLSCFLFLFQSSYSLNTYVGVKILNLTDDPANSCSGEIGYGFQGRIRALSSILPNFPIYMEIKNSSGSVIASGNVADSDYTIGDVMYFPTQVDLTVGADYTIFFDVDAIRIYLPLQDAGNVKSTVDNNYWTAGYRFTGSCSGGGGEASYTSSGCNYVGGSSTGCSVFNSKEIYSVNRSYDLTDPSPHSNYQLFALGSQFNINSQYYNLYQPTVGNFNIGFRFQ
jgi:hypothetical protein